MFHYLKNFDDKGFTALKKILKKKQNDNYWTCFVCQKQSNGYQIECGSCLNWGHKICAGLTDDDSAIAEEFFCNQCMSDYRKK